MNDGKSERARVSARERVRTRAGRVEMERAIIIRLLANFDPLSQTWTMTFVEFWFGIEKAAISTEIV